MNDKPFAIGARIRSFRHAAAGVLIVLVSQHNAWIHAVATLVVCAVGWYCRLTRFEWCWMIIATVAVWMAEAFNTAFEFLADVASPEFHPMVKRAKDVAAGAVLIAAVGSVAIALLVLGPHIFLSHVPQ